MKILGNGIAVLEGDSHVSKWIEEGGKLCHDQTVPLHILPLLKKGDWIVDGGANLGTHTVPYAQTVGESGHVFAFEPNPAVFECLVNNIKDCPNVTPHQYALSNQEAMGFLHLEKNVGASYVLPKGQHDRILPVRCRALDSFKFEKVNFIKLDVEGYELFALQGAIKTLHTHRPIILLELNRPVLARNGHTNEDILRFLSGLHYEYRPIAPDQKFTAEHFDLVALPK